MKDLRILFLLLAPLIMSSPLAAPRAELYPQAQAAGRDMIGEHIETLESMISMWPKQEYYLQLASLYGRVGNFDRQLELYEISNAMGWLTETAQFIRFARLLLWAGRTDEIDEFLRKALEKELEDSSRDGSKASGPTSGQYR